MKCNKAIKLMLISVLALPLNAYAVEKELQMEIDQVTVFRAGAMW